MVMYDVKLTELLMVNPNKPIIIANKDGTLKGALTDLAPLLAK